MDRSPIKVEWATPPEGWMLPAAAAFERVLLECRCASEIQPDPETLVVHVSVFPESARPTGVSGARLRKISQNLDLIASPIIKTMPSRSLCRSSFGTWLWRTGRLGKVLFAAVMIMTVLHSLDPFNKVETSTVNLQGCSGQSSMKHKTTIEFNVRNPFVMVIETVSVSAALFLAGHAVNLAMLKGCITCFDWLFVAFSVISMNTVWFLHEMTDLSWYVLRKPFFYWLIRCLNLTGTTCGIAALTTMDSWLLLSKRAKCLVLFVILSAVLRILYKSYIGHEWACDLWCVADGWCVEPRRMHLASVTNTALFLGKFLLSYLLGSEFVLLGTGLIRQQPLVQSHSQSVSMAQPGGSRDVSSAARSTRSNCSTVMSGIIDVSDKERACHHQGTKSRQQEPKSFYQESEISHQEPESRCRSTVLSGFNDMGDRELESHRQGLESCHQEPDSRCRSTVLSGFHDTSDKEVDRGVESRCQEQGSRHQERESRHQELEGHCQELEAIGGELVHSELTWGIHDSGLKKENNVRTLKSRPIEKE